MRNIFDKNRRSQIKWDSTISNRNKLKQNINNKIPIQRGCAAAKQGGCFCDGSCKEVIGYRDKLHEEV